MVSAASSSGRLNLNKPLGALPTAVRYALDVGCFHLLISKGLPVLSICCMRSSVLRSVQRDKNASHSISRRYCSDT